MCAETVQAAMLPLTKRSEDPLNLRLGMGGPSNSTDLARRLCHPCSRKRTKQPGDEKETTSKLCIMVPVFYENVRTMMQRRSSKTITGRSLMKRVMMQL